MLCVLVYLRFRLLYYTCLTLRSLLLMVLPDNLFRRLEFITFFLIL